MRNNKKIFFGFFAKLQAWVELSIPDGDGDGRLCQLFRAARSGRVLVVDERHPGKTLRQPPKGLMKLLSSFDFPGVPTMCHVKCN